jgi:hypothetical protein
LDSTEALILMLRGGEKVSKKIDKQIRERVAKNLCVCCGEKPIWRDGNCTSCDYEIEKAANALPISKRVMYFNDLYKSGLRLRPYEIRKYRKPESIIAKVAAS